MSNIFWQRYQKSHEYLQKKNMVSQTNENWDFYVGNQWNGIKGGNDNLPMLNFIKPVVKYKVSVVAQHSMVANYSDMSSRTEFVNIYKALNQRFSQSWEKAKMDVNAWECIKAGAVQGDSYLYFGSGDTNQEPQIIPNTSVLLGDENTAKLQDQPYIIIVERLSVEAIKKIAKENKINTDNIRADNDTTDQIVNKSEVSNKVTSILYMEKINGIVNIARATRDVVYEKLHPLNTTQNGVEVGGLKSYPIVSFIWEKKPNSARGVSEVRSLMPNQIELNKTLARRAITVKLMAFPRIAYDKTAIDDPSVLEITGAAIGVNTGGSQSINQAISYLNAANISSDADKLCNDLLVQSRELAGAGDYATGNVNPEQASGQAIIAVRDQSQVPLNEQVSLYTQFVEDVALLWFDLWTTYEPNDFLTEVDNGDGTTSEVPVSYDELMELKPSVRIDVSQDNQWTKLAEQQTIDNLFAQQQITLEEYAELCPDNGSMPKGKLLALLSKRNTNTDNMAQDALLNTGNQDGEEYPEDFQE